MRNRLAYYRRSLVSNARVLRARRRNPLRSDPTRTATIRRRFETDINARFRRIVADVLRLIVTEDSFGLTERKPLTNVFCPTGEGGGVDPTCSPGGSGGVSEFMQGAHKSMVDDDGNPRELFHGTSREFSELRAGEYGAAGPGIYLSTTRGKAESFADKDGGKVLKVYANLKNPLRVPYNETANAKEWAERARKEGHDGLLIPGQGEIVVFNPENTRIVANAFDPSQPRDEQGRWSDGGGEASNPVHEFIGQSVADELNNLRQRFSKLGGMLDANPVKVSVVSDFTESEIGGFKGAYFRETQEIKLWDVAELDDPLTLGAYNVGGSSLMGTYRHELGHHVEKLISDKDWDRWADTAWRNNDMQQLASQVSEYAGTNGSELFAESFAAYIHPEYKAGLLPKPLEQFWDSVIGSPTANAAGFTWGNVGRWRFNSSSEKVEAFREWLGGRLKKEILTDENTTADDWWRKYIELGYKQGQGRSFDDVRKPALAKSEDWYRGTKEQFLRSAFSKPVAVEKVELLAGRVFTELNGITSEMERRLTRALTDGLTQGKSPRDIARDINKEVGLGRYRSLVIARTEIVRAHAEGQLDAMEELGVKTLGVAVEWSTTGDDKVCELCEELEAIVITIEEARGLLPRHPQCRCAFKPANVGEDQEEQKRSRAEIKAAIRASVSAESGKDKTIKEKMEDTSWAGADATISKDRPKDILEDDED